MKKLRCCFRWQSVRRRIAPRFAAMRSGLFTHLSTDSVDAGRTSWQNKHLARASHTPQKPLKTAYTRSNNTALPATYAGNTEIPAHFCCFADTPQGGHNARPDTPLLPPICAHPCRARAMPHRAPALRRHAARMRTAQLIENKELFAPAFLPGNPKQGASPHASRPSSRACQQAYPQFLWKTRKSLFAATTWRAQFMEVTA